MQDYSSIELYRPMRDCQNWHDLQATLGTVCTTSTSDPSRRRLMRCVSSQRLTYNIHMQNGNYYVETLHFIICSKLQNSTLTCSTCPLEYHVTHTWKMDFLKSEEPSIFGGNNINIKHRGGCNNDVTYNIARVGFNCFQTCVVG